VIACFMRCLSVCSAIVAATVADLARGYLRAALLCGAVLLILVRRGLSHGYSCIAGVRSFWRNPHACDEEGGSVADCLLLA